LFESVCDITNGHCANFRRTSAAMHYAFIAPTQANYQSDVNVRMQGTRFHGS